MAIAQRLSDAKVVDTRCEPVDPKYPADQFKIWIDKAAYLAGQPDCEDKYKKWDGSAFVEMDQAGKDAVDQAEADAAAQAAADLRDLVKQVPAPAVEAIKILNDRINAVVAVIKTVAPGPGASLSTMTAGELLAAVDAALQ